VSNVISLETIYSTVRSFIYDNYLYARQDFELGPDDSMLGHGVIDSMGVLELVDFLRDAFKIETLDEHITEENFGTLSAISRYVMSRRSTEAGVSAA
jgi:acyl carrier protein